MLLSKAGRSAVSASMTPAAARRDSAFQPVSTGTLWDGLKQSPANVTITDNVKKDWTGLTGLNRIVKLGFLERKIFILSMEK
jgi:hypothetical protein